MSIHQFLNQADAFVESVPFQTYKAWLIGIALAVLLIIVIWEAIDKAKRGGG